MKKIIYLIFLLPVFSFGQARHKPHYGVFSWEDTAYFKNVPYNSGASIVHLGIDTNVLSPTFGKLVRKTAGGSTPTLQQVTDAGNLTTNAIASTILLQSRGDAGVNVVNGSSVIMSQIGKVNDTGFLLLARDANNVTVRPITLSGNRTQLLQNASGTIALKQDLKSKGVTIESPTSAENFGLWQTQVDITITSINAVVIGSSPSVTINIAFGSNITSLTNVFSSGTAITNTTTGQTINSGFNDATIPAGSWIRLTSSAQSGTVTQIEVTINYTED